MAQASVDQGKAANRSDGWWYPLIYVGGFLVIIAVNIVMVYDATRTFSGLTTQDPYLSGNSYNAEIDASDAQKKLGWSSDLGVDLVDSPPGLTVPKGAFPTKLTFTIVDRDNKPVEGLTVVAEIRRPAENNMDQRVDLSASDKGVYSQVVALPKLGQWEIRVVAEREKEVYRLNQRALVQAVSGP